MRGTGRVVFAGTLLLIVGTLNIIYGIGSLNDASILVGEKRIIYTNLHTMGWVLIILGVIELTGGLSLLAGNTYGRVIAVIGATKYGNGTIVTPGAKSPVVTPKTSFPPNSTETIVGCCEPGCHPNGSINVLLKSGDVVETMPGDDLYERALKGTWR